MRLAACAILCQLAVAGAAPEMLSGYAFLTPETQALQDDDFANPGMLWVESGQRIWSEAAERCAVLPGCHGDCTN